MKLIRETRRFAGGWQAESIGKPLVPAVMMEGRAVPRKIRFSHPGADGQPAITMELEMRDGVAQCRSIRLESVEDGREIRPVDLEVVRRRLYQWIGDVFAVMARRIEKTGPNTFQILDTFGPDAEAFEAALVAVTRARRPRKLDRSFLVRVADVYRENIAKAPTKAVAETFSVSHRTAASYVKQARDMDLLPPTTKGRKLI